MAQVHGDPDEIDAFAADVAAFNDSIEDAKGQVIGCFEAVKGTWNDPVQAAFEDNFDALLMQLEQFRQMSEEQIPRLHRHAEDLRTYLSC